MDQPPTKNGTSKNLGNLGWGLGTPTWGWVVPQLGIEIVQKGLILHITQASKTSITSLTNQAGCELIACDQSCNLGCPIFQFSGVTERRENAARIQKTTLGQNGYRNTCPQLSRAMVQRTQANTKQHTKDLRQNSSGMIWAAAAVMSGVFIGNICARRPYTKRSKMPQLKQCNSTSLEQEQNSVSTKYAMV